MGLVTVLYVFVKVSLFLPQWVEVRAFSILIVFSALSFEVLICSLNVSLGSKVSPSILGLRIVGSRVLSSCSDSSSLYSAGSGVKSVVIVLLALSFRSFAFVQVCTSSKLGCQGCQGGVVPLTGEHVVLLGVVRPLWSPPDTQLSPVAP